MNFLRTQKFLIENVKKNLLKEVDRYPEKWDGIELRERIKDVFSQVVIKRTMSKKRDYNNYCIVNGLL